MEKQNPSKNDLDFEETLKKILTGECTPDEEEQFYETYIWSENAEDFPYVKKAADEGCIAAYAPLADRYKAENGCSLDYEQAFHYWTLSVQNDGRGYNDIGDCYRLGLGVDKDYDKAWEAYETAVKRGDDLNKPSPEDFLLTGHDYLAIETKEIELDWLKYAVKKQTRPLPACIYGTIAAAYFEDDSDDYLFWTKLGSDAGDIGAKCIIFRHTADPAARQKLLQEIFHAKEYRGGSDDAAVDLAQAIIGDKAYEEIAAQFLDSMGEFHWLADYYQKQNRVDDLEYILGKADDGSEDEIPDGHFLCPGCNCILPLDEHSGRDCQGDYCNECYNSGNIKR